VYRFSITKLPNYPFTKSRPTLVIPAKPNDRLRCCLAVAWGPHLALKHKG
jgi:hypothetical protein